MIVSMFSIHDQTAEVYNKPFLSPNAALARRGFLEHIATGDKEHDVVKYPSEFSLYEIGSYDDNSAQLHPHQVPIFICRGTDKLTGDISNDISNTSKSKSA